MTTAFAQVRATVAEALLDSPALAGGRVYQNRVRPITQGEPSAINVRLLDSEGEPTLIEATHWHTVLQIECAARSAPGGEQAETRADALLESAFERLHGLERPGEIALIDIEEDASVVWDHDADDVPYACATLRVTVTHRTPKGSMQPWSET